MPGDVQVVSVGDERATEWDGFVAAHPAASAYHGYLWRGVIRRSFGCETHYLMATSAGGRVSGVLPVARLKSRLFGDFLVSLPYFNYGGPLSDSQAADTALTDHAVALAKSLGVGHLELRERTERNGPWAVRTDKVAMVLDLQPTTDQQFAALGSKLRSQVRRPQREGVAVECGGLELLPKFYRVFARNMRDLGTPVYAVGFFETMLTLLGDAAEIVVVSVGAVPAAAGFLIHLRGRTEIPWASSVREWNPVGVNMLLYWEAIKAAISRGSTQFDFGRSTAGAGTFRFKAQWGAGPQPLYWHYWLADGRDMPALRPDNPRFSMAIRTWQRIPVWAANLLGPPIVRNLP